MGAETRSENTEEQNKAPAPAPFSLPTLSVWARRFVELARYSYYLLRRTFLIFREERVHYQANALAYRSLISMVPGLAFLVSFFTLFKERMEVDLAAQVQAYLFQYLLPEAELAQKISTQIQVFIENAKDVTYLGFIILFITAIFLVDAVEEAFNNIWKIEQRRSYIQRFVTFTFVLIWGPVLVGMSVYITARYKVQDVLAQIRNLPLVREVHITGFLDELFLMLNQLSTYVVPFLLVFLMLTLLYIYLPNTKVESRAAIVSAGLAALLWEISKWAFSMFAAHIATSRERIFGSLAVFLVFLLWMYLTWIIILFGAQLCFVIQNYRFVTRVDPRGKNTIPDPFLAVQIMREIADRYARTVELPSVADLAERFAVSIPRLREIFGMLVQKKIVTRIGGGLEGRSYHTEVYAPARDLDRITLRDIVEAAGGNFLDTGSGEEGEISRIFQEVEESSFNRLERITLRELVHASEEQRNRG